MAEKSKAENTPITENTENPESETTEKGGGAPSGTGSASIDAIASNLSATMPEVQEHAIEQERATEESRLSQYGELRDRDGNGFDPSIHKVNGAGEPTLSPKGLLIKKPGRKAGQTTAQSASVIGGGVSGKTAVPDKEREAKLQARASGTMAANLILQIGIVTGGEEWHPIRDESTGLDEKQMLENAFADYFEATGKTDIPPGMALTVAVGAYALPRFTMPKTQSRMQKAKTAVKQWWVNRKLKKHGLKAAPINENANEKGA